MSPVALHLAACALLPLLAGAPDPAAVEIATPGLAPSSMNASGVLQEDWGAVRLTLAGQGIVVPSGDADLSQVKLDGVIPAARAVSRWGGVTLTVTAYRAPIWPAGVDVVTARVEETAGKPAQVTMTLETPANAGQGARTVTVGGRTVLALPASAVVNRPEREWGYLDEASSLPGWAHPEGDCDPAYRNIRAGMGGVPIVYRFPVTPGGRANVVLGICESHWVQAGQRPVVCRVEGAPSQTVDPIAAWGRHKPGALAFQAHDVNGDGKLDVVVAPGPGAPDRNPILNVIWVFAPGVEPNLPQVIAGKMNAQATWYVDVGGERDQSVYPPGKLEFALDLPAGGARELTFLSACPGGSAPSPAASAWTEDSLRRAALDVWKGWRPGK